jgi:hypothetical protein
MQCYSNGKKKYRKPPATFVLDVFFCRENENKYLHLLILMSLLKKTTPNYPFLPPFLSILYAKIKVATTKLIPETKIAILIPCEEIIWPRTSAAKASLPKS